MDLGEEEFQRLVNKLERVTTKGDFHYLESHVEDLGRRLSTVEKQVELLGKESFDSARVVRDIEDIRTALERFVKTELAELRTDVQKLREEVTKKADVDTEINLQRVYQDMHQLKRLLRQVQAEVHVVRTAPRPVIIQ